MSLLELVDNVRTDKNTLHSYLPLYEDLLKHKKETAKNVLEVGVRDGGSIKLWNDYFTNAMVHGLDISSVESMNLPSSITEAERIVLYGSTDAYNPEFFNETFLNAGKKFDFMLDDGPHSLESMISFIQLYSQVMEEDGILIVEDVQSFDWFGKLKDATPEHLKKHVRMFDLRHVKDRYDDLVFVIDKRAH